MEKQEKQFKIIGEPKNQIELLAFLKEDGILEIELAGKRWQKNAKKGVASFKIPLKDGQPIFRLIRQKRVVLTLVGPRRISVKGNDYQDLLYRADGVVEETIE